MFMKKPPNKNWGHISQDSLTKQNPSATVLTEFTLQTKGLGDLVDSDKRGVSNPPQDVWQNTGRLGPETDREDRKTNT